MYSIIKKFEIHYGTNTINVPRHSKLLSCISGAFVFIQCSAVELEKEVDTFTIEVIGTEERTTLDIDMEFLGTIKLSSHEYVHYHVFWRYD